MKNQKRIIITVLLVVEVISIFLTWKSYNAGKILEDKVENNVTNEHFAFYIKENGVYKERIDSTFPAGYHIDKNMTVCVDENQEKLNDIPIQMDSNGNITVTSNRTVYCTFYLYGETTGDYVISKMPKGLTKTTNPNDDLEYRFSGNSGTDVNNYICFGTSNKTDCILEEENYMYRIIGVGKDGRLKLLKDYSIEKRTWNDDDSSDAVWGKYAGYDRAVLSSYLDSEWIETLSDWQEKIDDNMWNIGYVTHYSDHNDSPTIPGVGARVMGYEQNGAKSSAKIGLIYPSDYYYAKDITGNTNCLYDLENHVCKNWMNLQDAWTISRGDLDYAIDGKNYAYEVDEDSIMLQPFPTSYLSNVYPVFYLKYDVSIASGDGSPTNPFIISE